MLNTIIEDLTSDIEDLEAVNLELSTQIEDLSARLMTTGTGWDGRFSRISRCLYLNSREICHCVS